MPPPLFAIEYDDALLMARVLRVALVVGCSRLAHVAGFQTSCILLSVEDLGMVESLELEVYWRREKGSRKTPQEEKEGDSPEKVRCYQKAD